MTEPLSTNDEFDVAVNRVAKGGAALGSAPDGRVTFVHGAIPGETATVRPTLLHKRRIEAACIDVVSPSDHRVTPTCPHVGEGCGGCDWQHVEPVHQSALRVDIVADCLRRLGKIDDVQIEPGKPLPPWEYRTTVRVGVKDGKAAYRARSSHDLVSVSQCPIAHPLVEELLVEGFFGSSSEVTIKVGANTGERMVIVDPSAKGVDVADDVVVVGTDELASGRIPHIHEEIGGVRFQVSAPSFFQCRPDGALQLAQLAGDAVADGEGTLLDAYCGVGLFAALAGIGRNVIGVESNPHAVADARINAGPHAKIVESRFEAWNPEPVGVAIADPSRSGLGQVGCDRIAATGASHVALVSCDPASLARDASLLATLGYQLDHVHVVDLFGQTSHVETVSRFVKH